MQSTWIEDSFAPPYEPRVPTDRDMGGAGCLLVQHHVPARLHARVEADSELGDDVASGSRSIDQVPKHRSGAPALDRSHAASFESEDHRLVDETLDRVRDGQVGDEDAVSRVLERRDEDLPARIVAVLAGPERVRIGKPGPAGDPEGKVGAGRAAEPHRVGAPNLGEEPFGNRCQIRCGLRELVRQQRGVDEPEEEATSAAAERGLVQLRTERSFVASRLLLERERTSACRAASSIGRGEEGERTLARPEMELGFRAGVARGGEELRTGLC